MGKKKKKDSTNKKVETSEEKVFIRKASELFGREDQGQQNRFENEVQELWHIAQERGYETLKDFIASLYNSWDEEQEILVISQLYNSFLLAIQQGVEDRSGEKVWGLEDTFRDWLYHSKRNLIKRLEELKIDYKKGKTSFSSYNNLLVDMDNLPGRVGEPLRTEDRDFYELVLRRTKETVEKAIKNPSWIDSCLKKADELIGKQ